MKSSSFRPAWCALLCALLACLAFRPACAADATATAALSDSQTDPGQSVDYTITVNGGEGRVPENIEVDGLSITYTGQSTQTQINFGTLFGSGSHRETSTVYTYSVVPQRPGRFVIPAQTVEVDGQRISTHPVSLAVGGGNAGGNSNPAADAGGSSSGNDLYFAQIIIPKTNVYIGEAVPMEARIYVDARIAVQLLGPPEIPVESCTMQPLTKPAQAQVERNGRQYVVVTYKTALTPAKAGTLKAGPVSIGCLVRLPQARTHRRSAFNSPFDDPFFDDAFRMMGAPQQVAIKSDVTELNVKPLPAAGQPKSFAGAVGKYTLSTSAKPSTVQAGDPITLTAKIEGRGNFDRVTAPQLADPAGWRAYPPSAKFSADDDIGVSGAKTFEMAVIPGPGKTASPELEWSYFDPEQERYVTLKGASVPLKVEGQAAPAPTPVMAQQATPPPSVPAPDILYIRADSTGWGRTFEPLYENRSFWTAQAVPLLALLGFIALRINGIRAADLQARERAQWRREKETALAQVRRRGASEGELCQSATQALRLEAALQTGRPAATLHASDVLAGRQLDPATEAQIRRLFDRQAEMLYAGASGGTRPASPETQAETLDLLGKYESAKVIS